MTHKTFIDGWKFLQKKAAPGFDLTTMRSALKSNPPTVITVVPWIKHIMRPITLKSTESCGILHCGYLCCHANTTLSCGRLHNYPVAICIIILWPSALLSCGHLHHYPVDIYIIILWTSTSLSCGHLLDHDAMPYTLPCIHLYSSVTV